MRNFIPKIQMMLIIFFFAGCHSDDLELENEEQELEYNASNLEGDWLKTGIYYADEDEPWKKVETTTNYMDAIDQCEKDDIYRFSITSSSINNYYIGLNSMLCENQKENTFSKISTWTIDSSGRLNFIFEEKEESYQLLILSNQILIISNSEIFYQGDEGKHLVEKFIRLD